MARESFVLLDGRAVLVVSGPDRRAFLQGLVSNDVEKLGPKRALYAALLTAQGKYLFDFFMVEAGEAIWLEAEAARLSDLKRRLSTYRLRAKVALDEMPQLAVAAVLGSGAPAALGLPPAPGAAREFGGGTIYVDPRLSQLGARAILPREGARASLAGMGLAEADFALYERLRLALGVADGGRDLVVDKSILLEAGFDELHGVDWQKGCYVGQELTARTKYRGLVKRRLVPVAITGAAPPPGALVTLEGREVGEMRSNHEGKGLALLRIEAAHDGRPLECGEARLLPSVPDWMRLDRPEAAGAPTSAR
ncbi:MAG TPA: folate-binding protein [Stellaceae bacterium]|nr:folate-binding protein [Stellaceae bacterium]